MTKESEGRTFQVGDLVKMKAGHSAPGTVLEVMDYHPRADEPQFRTIRQVLDQPYVKVFWSDHEVSNLVPIFQIVRFECE